MTDDTEPSLESALAKSEADAGAAVKAAGNVSTALKRFQAAARTGKLRDLRAALANAEQALEGLQQHVAAVRAGWDFDEQGHLSSGAYARELKRQAERAQLKMFELDDRLYSYPSLVRIVPGERAVLIDKARERRLRPSVLVAHLKELQQRPTQFRSDAFLKALHDTYIIEMQRQGKDPREGSGVRLIAIYTLLTLLPGQSREYSVQEFGRDLYLLDQSGVTTTGNMMLRFSASTGTRSTRGVIRVITQSGEEKLYFGISFVKIAPTSTGERGGERDA